MEDEKCKECGEEYFGGLDCRGISWIGGKRYGVDIEEIPKKKKSCSQKDEENRFGRRDEISGLRQIDSKKNEKCEPESKEAEEYGGDSE